MAEAALAQSRCPTSVLSDSPTKQDAFGHQSVADAIADLITTSEGGKAVAITGSWGSGKSSVIELLREHLRTEAPNTRTFVFDAWAHQGDPLRRTFLEQLVEDLIEIGWVRDAASWHERKEELARRLQKVSSVSRPMLTWIGAMFAMLLLLAPVGFQLFAKYDSQKFDHPRLAVLGMVIGLLPFLFGLAVFIYWRPTWKLWTREFWSRNRTPHQDESLLSVFLNKTQERSETTTVRTADPTSLEFQAFFGDLLDEALAEDNRRLVIVIDNLDRVESGDALAIWATMKTFFDFGSRTCANWRSRMWLLVPFDPSALKRLWPTGDLTEPKGETAQDGGVTDAFVDKTFQVSFRVSPPVLSDWRSFFEQQLAMAFPVNHVAEDFHTIYRLYDLKRLNGMRPPTPRDIKLFVNRIGAIHRQWQDQISLPLQALYVLLAMEFPELEAQLATDPELIKPVPIELVGSDWRTAISAIHFNVGTEKALQVALGEPIRAALEVQEKADKLKELQQIQGFHAVLERVVERSHSDWAKAEPSLLAAAANALQELGPASDPSLRKSWDWLTSGVLAVESWKRLDEKIGSGIRRIFEYAPSENLGTHIIRSLIASFDEPIAQNAADYAQLWMTGAAAAVRPIRRMYEPIVVRHFSVPGSPSMYLACIRVLTANSNLNDIASLCKPSAGPSAVMSTLSADVPNGTFDDSSWTIVQTLLAIPAEWPWETLVTTLDARIRTTNQLPGKEIRAIFATLLRLASTVDSAASALKAAAIDGYTALHLNWVRSENDQEAIAILLLVMLEHVRTWSLPSSPSPAANTGMTRYQEFMTAASVDAGLVSTFVDGAIRFHKVGLLVAAYDGFEASRPFTTAALRSLAERQDAASIFTVQTLVDDFSVFRRALAPDELKNLIEVGCSNLGLQDVLAQRPFSAESSDLYLLAMRCPGPSVVLKDFLPGGLHSVPKDVWATQLVSEGPLVEVAFELLEGGANVALSTAFQDALLTHAEQLEAGTATVQRLRTKWTKILDLLPPGLRETFFYRLSDLLCKSDQSVAKLLDVYGPALAIAPAVKRNGERIVLEAFPKMLHRRVAAELTWMEDLLANQKLLATVGKAASLDFRERLTSLSLDELDPELKTIISSIRKAAGMSEGEGL